MLVVLAAYTLDGDHRGWVTSRGTISGRLDKAERIEQGEAVLRRITALEYEWRGHGLSWIQERAPQPVAAKSNNATTKVDTADSARVRSSTPERTMKQPKSKPAPKPTTVSPTKLLPDKPVMRTTAARHVEATAGRLTRRGYKQPETFTINADNTGKPCLCGCGELVAGFLKRGHFVKLNSKLMAISRGELTPDKAFGKRLATAWGPWTKTSQGHRNIISSYAHVRAKLG